MAVAAAAAATANTAFSFPCGKLAPKPLMLKDFLRQDLGSESFRATPTPGRPQRTTVRYFLEAEFKKSRFNSVRERLLKGTSKISAILNAVGILSVVSFSSSCSSCASNASKSKPSLLPRGFSRRLLRRSFRNKRARDACSSRNANTGSKGRMLIRDIVRLSSFTDDTRDGKAVHVPADLCAPASPTTVSSSSSYWSESGSLSSASDSLPSPPMLDASSDFASSDANSLEKKKTGTTTAMVMNGPLSVTCDGPDGGVDGDSSSAETAASHRDPKRKMGGTRRMKCTCNPYDERDQFGAVCVMDFTGEAEDGSEYAPATPPSSPFLAKLEYTRHDLLHRIRRFVTLFPAVDPIDLDDDNSTPKKQSDLERRDEEQEQEVLLARELVEQIKIVGGSFKYDDGDDNDVLLLDFFIEGLRAEAKRREPTRHVKVERRKEQTVGEELLCAARDWVDGTGRLAVDRTGIRPQIEETEGDGRWRCFDADEDEIAAHVERRVFGSLVEDLLHELLTG